MSYFKNLFGSKEMRILILGLDGAGKTTLLYRLQVRWLWRIKVTVNKISAEDEKVTLNILGWRSCHNDTYNWLQCWTSDLQKFEISSVGLGRTDIHQVSQKLNMVVTNEVCDITQFTHIVFLSFLDLTGGVTTQTQTPSFMSSTQQTETEWAFRNRNSSQCSRYSTRGFFSCPSFY